jgi:archaellum biogenesis ATPase FlaH
MKEIKEKIKEEIEPMSNKFIVLLDTPAEKYCDAAMCSADFMVGKGRTGVYVSASRPYRFMLKEMQKRGINPDNLLFIDCISRMAGEQPRGKCLYVENPSALGEISLHIASILDKIESNEKFLIMDSLSTLLIYNSANSIKDFLTFLINKLRLEGIDCIILVIEQEAPPDLRSALVGMCDKSITFNGMDFAGG